MRYQTYETFIKRCNLAQTSTFGQKQAKYCWQPLVRVGPMMTFHAELLFAMSFRVEAVNWVQLYCIVWFALQHQSVIWALQQSTANKWQKGKENDKNHVFHMNMEFGRHASTIVILSTIVLYNRIVCPYSCPNKTDAEQQNRKESYTEYPN